MARKLLVATLEQDSVSVISTLMSSIRFFTQLVAVNNKSAYGSLERTSQTT
jgi:hypothetical protein